MGLDQYLYAKRYYSDYDFNKSEEREKFAELQKVWGEAIPRQTCGAAGMSFEIVHTVAYWRKANAIHGWFVRSFGNGEDDCREMSVPREGLESLLHLCEGLLADKNAVIAGGELPPTEGFFFGSYEIDEWYWQDLEVTVSQLKSILNDWFPRSEEHKSYVEFVYQASW